MGPKRKSKIQLPTEKLYYSIREVSQFTELEQYVLRFWEKEFPQLRPKKNRAGNRTYQDKDIKLILEIKRLLYAEGYTIEGARRRLRRRKHKKGESGELIQEIKAELEELLKLFY